MSDPAIEVAGARKRFGDVEALRGVDLRVERGEVFGFLGPNGAGKTTAIRILMGFVRRDAGEARVLGLDAWRDTVAVKARVGFLPDVIAFGGGFTGQAFLDYTASLRGMRGQSRRQTELLDRLQLSRSALQRKVRGYSAGMAKKLALVQAMQHDPELLIMDEPTEALDPLIRQELFGLIRETQQRGASVFMSSHVLPDVQEVCERVALIRTGRIVETGAVDALRQGKRRTMTVEFRTPPPDGFSVPGVEVLSREGARWRLGVSGDVNDVVRELAKHDLADLIYERMDLDELFLRYYEADESGEADGDA